MAGTDQFWRDWVIGAGCKRVFLVDSNVQPGDCKVTVRIGVSLVLMGVIDVFVTQRNENRSGVWFGENSSQLDDIVNAKVVERIPRTASWNEVVLSTWPGCMYAHRTRSEQWVLYCTNGGELGIKSMAAAEGELTVVVHVPLRIRYCCMSQTGRSQAVILGKLENVNEANRQLLVVDVAATYATKKYVMGCEKARVLAMEDKSGQSVFIVEILYDSLSGPWAVVFSVKPNSDGNAKMRHCLQSPSSIMNHVCGPLFSVYHPELTALDVVDCNDLDTTNIRIPDVHSARNCTAGGGFMFVVSGTPHSLLQVIEPLSVFVVAIVDFLAPGFRVDEIQETSLWF
ncbi:hypothetical protein Pelo_17494 [Pelomyxa schiedti]|nr:hypothetical protein Pelo_17494 [Pelomyxa schiedti]